MAVEFLGHKQSLLEFLMAPIDKASRGKPLRVADLFCGTGAVSAALKMRGYEVVANDTLAVCSTFAEAVLLNDDEPAFAAVVDRLPTVPGASAYERVLAYLNALPPRDGFIQRNYSPRSSQFGAHERMYFTERNAGCIDAIRSRIEAWGELLKVGERAVLLADLVRAANAVSNIAGTFGCYLKHWKARAFTPLTMRTSQFAVGRGRHRVMRDDAMRAVADLDVDIVYADPPYTKRQYSAYYHIPETIVLDDTPKLSGSTGLRPWREKKSQWCYRREAPTALAELVQHSPGEWFFLSYNEDGQIPHEEVLRILSAHGKVAVFETCYRRYKSASRTHRGNELTERLYRLHRSRH